MSNTTPDTRTLLAEAASTAKELVPSLNSPEYRKDFCDVDESGIEQYNLHLREVQKKLIAMSFRLEKIVTSGEGWACTLAREGLECARGAKVEVDGLLQACEVNPNNQIKRSRELLACFGDPEFPGVPLDLEVRKIYAFEAAARGAARLPLHGQLLGEWADQIGEVVDMTCIEVETHESNKAALYPEAAGTYLWEERGKTVALKTCIKYASTKLKDPKYRTADGERIFKWAVEELARDQESAAAAKVDKKILKNRGNSQTTNYSKDKF